MSSLRGFLTRQPVLCSEVKALRAEHKKVQAHVAYLGAKGQLSDADQTDKVRSEEKMACLVLKIADLILRIKSSGAAGFMVFQAITDVEKPLASASRITAKGNRIVLDDATHESYIENKASGVRIPLRIENGVYMMEMLVTPFQGQTR